jgi:hypothetical protein
VDETHSASGQVVLIRGTGQDDTTISSVRLVDLATGVCTPQADLLHTRSNFAAARLPDGGIACAGGFGELSTAEMWERPVQGALEAVWTWRGLPAVSAWRTGCSGCVLSDGRFAVLGGYGYGACMSPCEALTLGDDQHWSPLPPMHDTRAYFACAAVAASIIVAGGGGFFSASQPKSTTRCLVGGCGFRMICLTTVDWRVWGVRLYRRSVDM